MKQMWAWMSRHKQIIRYLIFGVLTTVVSLGLYALCTMTFLNPQDSTQLAAANIISWIGSVTFAYITNRKYVFESKSSQKLREAASFFLSRISTLLIDMACMHIFVQWIRMDDKIAKLIVQVILVITNYVLSRFLVFRQKAPESGKTDTEHRGMDS